MSPLYNLATDKYTVLMNSITKTQNPPRLLNELRTVIRSKHFSFTTEEAYVYRVLFCTHRSNPPWLPQAGTKAKKRARNAISTGSKCKWISMQQQAS